MSKKPSKQEAEDALRDNVDPIVVWDVDSLVKGVTEQLEGGK